MTVQNPPLYLQAGSHPAEDFRHLISQGFGGRDGVIQGGLAVTEKSGTPNMSVDVAEGSILIAGDEATYQGLYLCHNRGTTNLTISAADGSNPRWDLIVAKVQDSDYSGATDSWSLAVVTGTAAASPAFPSVPSNAFVLAVVAVAAAASSITNANISDIRVGAATDSSPGPGTTTITNYGYAASLGGTIVCTSATRPTSPLEGMRIYETDTDIEYVYNGSLWKPRSAVGWHTYMGSSQTIATATATDLNLTSEYRDDMGFHTGSNTYVTIPTNGAGYYSLATAVNWPTNTTGVRYIGIYVNSVGNYVARSKLDADTALTSAHYQHASGTKYLNAGDQLYVEVYQTSGGNLTYPASTSADNLRSSFSGVRIG